MSYENIREEELKNKIANDYFDGFDCTKIIGNIDFCVTLRKLVKTQETLFETESLLWAEAKKGKSDIYKSIVQLILTIGKARTFDKYLPPAFIGAYDAEKIAFIAYNDIHEIFYANDFNWNVTPSDYETKEFQLVLDKVTQTIDSKSLLFYFASDQKEINAFIKSNFVLGKSHASKIKIDKNNFIVIYNKWVATVKPTISVRWDIAKKNGVIDGDFYLADLLSRDNETIKEKLYVLLQKDRYQLDRKLNEMGMFNSNSVNFKDKQKAHIQFWNKYERPPKQEYWDYIVERRDLLVPQDVRERKGSFFTPQIWVELSQKYLSDVLGEDWQDEYYIWDCAAGTGNLLAGLTNKYNIWASTLDTQDVDVMHDRIDTMNSNSISGNGATLLHDHVFQFDFLNDDFSKLPKGLQDIINNPEKRKKLVIYINPPYAETNAKKGAESGENIGKIGVNLTKQRDRYNDFLGKGKRELYAQFVVRIYGEIEGCKIAIFSKLKILNAPFYLNFRNHFYAKLEKIFIVPADTFDNVKGQFPIGFQIWDTNKKEKFELVYADVYDFKGIFISVKGFYAYENVKYVNNWIIEKRKKKDTQQKKEKQKKEKKQIADNENIGKIFCVGSDFQHQSYCRLNSQNIPKQAGFTIIEVYEQNITECCIFYAVRHCIPASWLNDRDQFLYPNDGWETDTEFQNDCLAYTLFNNNIQSQYGTNHWIPFTEYEVASREKFESHFMTDFIEGKINKANMVSELFVNQQETDNRTTPLEFSLEAKALFNASRKLWRYYHNQPNCNVNASLYDIREHFQGRDIKGKMNNKSDDVQYTKLIADLRFQLKLLAKKIEPKVYKYGFLKA